MKSKGTENDGKRGRRGKRQKPTAGEESETTNASAPKKTTKTNRVTYIHTTTKPTHDRPPPNEKTDPAGRKTHTTRRLQAYTGGDTPRGGTRAKAVATPLAFVPTTFARFRCRWNLDPK